MNVAKLFVPANFGEYHGSILYISLACALANDKHVACYRYDAGYIDL